MNSKERYAVMWGHIMALDHLVGDLIKRLHSLEELQSARECVELANSGFGEVFKEFIQEIPEANELLTPEVYFVKSGYQNSIGSALQIITRIERGSSPETPSEPDRFIGFIPPSDGEYQP